MVKRLMNRLKCRKGQSLVETALVLPVVIMLFCGIADFGWIMANTLIVENGSREGARYGTLVAAESDCVSQIQNRVLSVMPAYSHKGMIVATTITNPSDPSKGDVKVTVKFTFTLLTPVAQTILGKQDYTTSSTCIMKAE
jgi:Flp pilus assembly protein TadG